MNELQDEVIQLESSEPVASEDFFAGSPENPVSFGKYQLLGQLARGGMAEIYRARSSTSIPPQLLAIKCMKQSLAQESRFVEMFIREGKLAMLLEHPSIVQTFDVGCIDQRYFIAMEHISGKDLTNILRRCQETGRRIPIPHALHIAQAMCRALHYAHTLQTAGQRSLHVVNRDVSPSNIRISYEGQAKLLDFGIAQALLQVTSEIGVLKGKFSYMSPEQVRGMPMDHRTDIFSAGIVLYEMLTCSRLFREESEFVLMEMVRRAEIRPPSAVNPRIPAELDAIVMRALNREVEGRWPDAQSMATELAKLLENYQYSPGELGELLRSLFAADYKHDQMIERRCLSGPLSDLEEVTLIKKNKRSKTLSHGERRRAVIKATPRYRIKVIYTVALVVLLAGILLLVLALR